jgi:pilus assembly protein CpaF
MGTVFKEMGRVIGFLDTDRDVSAFSLCVNFALAAACRSGNKTAVVDCAGVFGALPAGVLHSIESTEGPACPGLVLKNAAGGAGPEDIIRQLKDGYAWCAAALGPVRAAGGFGLFDLCDEIILPVHADAVSAAGAAAAVWFLAANNFPSSKIKPVFIAASLKQALDRKGAERCLGVAFAGEIPLDLGTLYAQFDGGGFAVISNPHSPYSRAVKMLAVEIMDSAALKTTTPADVRSGTSDETSVKQRVHERFMKEVDLKSLERETSGCGSPREAMYKMVSEKVAAILGEEGDTLVRDERLRISGVLMDDILGLGPLEPLLKDPGISEIMINGKDAVFIERRGKIAASDVKFESEAQLMTVIERILAGVGRKIDEGMPLVDARLKDGSRVNVIIPPLALTGPCVTVRRFPENRPDCEYLVQAGSLSREMARFLRLCVAVRKNIVLSGGTGSGKTTMLNVLSSFIPDGERIITIEDSAELRLNQKHVVTLEARPANLEGAGEIPIRKLVINALRMRPDRIIVGECRGGEALDMLQAMNTGHDGSMTTLHANSPKDAVSRLLTMVIMSGAGLPEKAILDQIGGAVDMLVQVGRLNDGSRKILNICRIIRQDDRLEAADIFRFRQTGVETGGGITGVFEACGDTSDIAEEARLRLGPSEFNRIAACQGCG